MSGVAANKAASVSCILQLKAVNNGGAIVVGHVVGHIS
jgi:hypothetical protein